MTAARTIPAQPLELEGLIAPTERIARNNGDDLELSDGTIVLAGDLAVVDVDDPIVAIEAMFGRLELNPETSKVARPARWPGGLELNSTGVDVSAGVNL